MHSYTRDSGARSPHPKPGIPKVHHSRGRRSTSSRILNTTRTKHRQCRASKGMIGSPLSVVKKSQLRLASLGRELVSRGSVCKHAD